jgi:hypothetical protein
LLTFAVAIGATTPVAATRLFPLLPSLPPETAVLARVVEVRSLQMINNSDHSF